MPRGRLRVAGVRGFAGEVCFGGHRATDGLGRLAASLASLGGQAGRWEADSFGVTADVITFHRPEDGSQMVMAATARLDARPELAAQLKLSVAEAEQQSDAELLSRAYLRWGPDLAEHVLGDWVCAVWDTANERFWLARDAAGNTGLHWWHEGRRLVFSTHLPALLQHPWVPVRPNERRIARHVAVIYDRHDPMSTVYAGIQTLPGGHALSIDASGATITCWWHPQALPQWSGASDDQYLARFTEVYRQAVEDRMPAANSRLGLMLSGGLDSGSVSAVAAHAAARHHVRLDAYTSVPAFAAEGAPINRDGDEEILAGATAAYLGLADRWTLVRCESAGFVESLGEIQRVHARPIHATSNYYWLAAILRRARHDDVRTMLTGQGGNLSVSWPGSGGWRRHPRALRAWWRSLRSPRPGREVPRSSPISAAWAQSLSLQYPRARFSDQRALLADGRLGRMASGSLGSLWMELGAAHGVDVRDPTRDRRVIECCWQLPDRMFTDRGLIRRSFRGRLPDAVLDSRRRGLQAADLGHRMLLQQSEIRSLLDRLSRHTLARDWLDVTLMRRVLDDLRGGVTPERSRAATTILVRGLGTGLFLERF